MSKQFITEHIPLRGYPNVLQAICGFLVSQGFMNKCSTEKFADYNLLVDETSELNNFTISSDIVKIADMAPSSVGSWLVVNIDDSNLITLNRVICNEHSHIESSEL